MEVKTRKSNVGNINQSQPKPEEETTYFYSLPAEDADDDWESGDEYAAQTEDQNQSDLIVQIFTLKYKEFL